MFNHFALATVLTFGLTIVINGQPTKNLITKNKAEIKWEEAVGGKEAAKALACFDNLSPETIRERLQQMRKPAYLPDHRFVKKIIELQNLPLASDKEVEQIKTALQPVLDYHERSRMPIYVLQSEQPKAMIVDRAVIIVTTQLLRYAKEEEIRGIVAHELAHEYVWDERIQARKAKNWELIRGFELFCDAVAVFSLKELGDDPMSYIRILERMAVSSKVADIIAGKVTSWERRSHPPLDARKKLIKFLCQQFD